MNRATLTFGLTLLCLLCSCKPALRNLETIEAFTGVSQGGAVEDLVQQAKAGWLEQTPASVLRSTNQYKVAAGRQPEHAEHWIGYIQGATWLTDHEPSPEVRKRMASDAVRAAQWCQIETAGDWRCDYWLAIAIGVQARERKSTGLDALPRMIEILEKMDEEHPNYEQAGASRVLSLLYLRAPDWPTGPGDLDLGLEYAEAAIERAPDWPPNVLAIAEAYEKLEDWEKAADSYEKARTLAQQMTEKGHKISEAWAVDAQEGLSRVDHSQ